MVRSAITTRMTVAILASQPDPSQRLERLRRPPARSALVVEDTSGTQVATARNIQKMKRQGRVPTMPEAR